MSTPRPTEADMEAAMRRVLADEIANLADDGARLSHSVVRRMEAVLAGGDERQQKVTENPQEFLMRTLSKDQWRVVAECLRVEKAEAVAEHQREVEALRAERDSARQRYAALHAEWGREIDHCEAARARAEAAERDRDEARRELADLRAMVADMRAGIWRLGESIHGDEGVEHVEGCEGEPTCFACILADLRALLPTEDDQ